MFFVIRSQQHRKRGQLFSAWVLWNLMVTVKLWIPQELMTYCADDVKATHAVFKQMWPQFKTRCLILLYIEFCCHYILMMFYWKIRFYAKMFVCNSVWFSVLLLVFTSTVVRYSWVLYHITNVCQSVLMFCPDNTVLFLVFIACRLTLINL